MLVSGEANTRFRKTQFTDTRFINLGFRVSIDLEKSGKVSVKKILFFKLEIKELNFLF